MFGTIKKDAWALALVLLLVVVWGAVIVVAVKVTRLRNWKPSAFLLAAGGEKGGDRGRCSSRQNRRPGERDRAEARAEKWVSCLGLLFVAACILSILTITSLRRRGGPQSGIGLPKYGTDLARVTRHVALSSEEEATTAPGPFALCPTMAGGTEAFCREKFDELASLLDAADASDLDPGTEGKAKDVLVPIAWRCIPRDCDRLIQKVRAVWKPAASSSVTRALSPDPFIACPLDEGTEAFCVEKLDEVVGLASKADVESLDPGTEGRIKDMLTPMARRCLPRGCSSFSTKVREVFGAAAPTEFR